jgi:hypothetical protein
MADDLRALQAAIAGEPTNQQIDELWDEVASYFHLYDEARELVREALARWGPRAALAEGAGVGASDGALDGLFDVACATSGQSARSLRINRVQFRKAARDALARYGTPRPIPVAERLEALEALSRDAVSALRYIEQQHGRLYGVGWDRVFDAAAAIPLPEA